MVPLGWVLTLGFGDQLPQAAAQRAGRPSSLLPPYGTRLRVGRQRCCWITRPSDLNGRGFGRYDGPTEYVGWHPDESHHGQGEDCPYEPNQGGIHLQVSGDPPAHSGHHPIASRTVESSHPSTSCHCLPRERAAQGSCLRPIDARAQFAQATALDYNMAIARRLRRGHPERKPRLRASGEPR